LVSGLLVESLMLSIAAAGLAVLVALWGIDIARAALPEGIARSDAIALDLRVLGAAIAAAVATGLVFGAVPAWQASRVDVVTLLKDGSPTTSTGRRPWRTAFAVFEVALVAMLLVATTLVVISFVNVTRADIGFDRDRLIATDSVRFSGSLEAALDQLRAVPGITAAGALAMGSPPLVMRGLRAGGASSMDLHRPGATAIVNAESRRVSDGYFQTAGMTLRRGSGFDRATGPAVILDELCARQLFPDRDPIGATVRLGPPRPNASPADDLTVIGVVATVRIDGPEREARPQVYLPLVRRDGSTTPVPSINGGNVQFLVRTSGAAAAAVPAVAVALTRLSPPRPGWPPPRVMVVEDAFRNITADRRFNAGLMSVFGTLALAIGAAGLYGVLSSIVAQQSREIGVRMALGANAARIHRDVLAQAGRYLAAGLAIGLPAAWLVSRAFSTLYFAVTPADVLVYLVVASVMTATGVIAAIVPARRASKTDPMVTLKT
jgi:predicted permease